MMDPLEAADQAMLEHAPDKYRKEGNRVVQTRAKFCPKCGCRAMYVKMLAEVTCELNDDFTIGRTKSVGKRRGEKPARYVCGGGHEFVGEDPLPHEYSP